MLSHLSPELGRSPGEGNSYLLQYSCLENSMDRGAWQATVHGVAKYQTWLSDFHFTSFKSCQTFCDLWPIAHQAPLSMSFSRQEYWSGLPFPPPGESSWLRDQCWVSCIGRQTLYHREPLGKATYHCSSIWIYFMTQALGTVLHLEWMNRNFQPSKALHCEKLTRGHKW